MNAILDELKNDHAELRRIVSAFERQTALLSKGELSDYGLLEDLAEFFASVPDEAHHRVEDAVYLRLAERLGDDIAKHSENVHGLFDLRAEHRELADFAATFREGVAQILAGAELPRAELAEIATAYIEKFRAHMLNEEMHFFPVAGEFLTEEDWGAIDEKVSALKDDATLQKKAESFARMRAEIDAAS